jgi:aryl-alcohol dehydrogenase-like predicted oxidoreductase
MLRVLFRFATMADAKTKAAKSAFDVSIDGGITLFDTAEVYGSWVRRPCYSVLLFLPGLIKKKLVDLKMLSLLYLQLLNGAVNSETILGRYTAEF